MATMSTVIWSVPKAIALAYIPTFVRAFIVKRYGKFDNTKPRDEQGQNETLPVKIRDVAQRLKNCHLNQMETIGYFAAAVAIGVATRTPVSTLDRLTSWYLKSRLGYVLAYAAPQVGNGALRSLTFVASVTSCMLIYAAAADASISLAE